MIGGLFSSVKFEVSGGGPIEFIDPFHPNLLTYKILASTGDEFESVYIRDRFVRDGQLKDSRFADTEIGHLCMMNRMTDILVLIQVKKN